MRAILSHIIRSVCVVEVNKSGPDGALSYDLYRLIRHKGKIRVKRRMRGISRQEIDSECKQRLVIVLIGSAMSVNKEYPRGSRFLGSVTDNPGEYVHTALQSGPDNIRLIFMRRDVYDRIREEFPGALSFHMASGVPICRELQLIGEEFFGSDLNLRATILSDDGDKIAGIAFSKLAMPVLTVMLAILLCNYFIGSSLQTDISRQQSELMIRNADSKSRKEKSRDAIGYRAYKSRYPYSVVAGEIGRCVPDGLMLTRLGINPLAKKIVADKPVELAEGIAVITGECTSSETIIAFARNLDKSATLSGSKVKSMDKDRSGKYIFTIEVAL